MHKTLIPPHIEYCPQDRALVSGHGNWSVILKFESIQRVTKMIKRVKDYSYSEKLKKIMIYNYTRKKSERWFNCNLQNDWWKF